MGTKQAPLRSLPDAGSSGSLIRPKPSSTITPSAAAITRRLKSSSRQLRRHFRVGADSVGASELANNAVETANVVNDSLTLSDLAGANANGAIMYGAVANLTTPIHECERPELDARTVGIYAADAAARADGLSDPARAPWRRGPPHCRPRRPCPG